MMHPIQLAHPDYDLNSALSRISKKDWLLIPNAIREELLLAYEFGIMVGRDATRNETPNPESGSL